MGTASEPASRPYDGVTWTSAKIIALILAVVIVASAGGAGFSYYVLRPAASLPKGQCSNSATNYPSCNVCASGSTFTSGACYTSCLGGATNPPICNKYPPCSNRGTDPPTCTPPCSNGASNPPACNNQTTTILDCTPGTVEARFTYSMCSVTVYADITPTGEALIDCQPHSSSGSPECNYTPTGTCPLMSGTNPDVSSCSFSVEATGLSLTVYATYTGEQINGARVLANSTGSFRFTVTQPPSSVIVTGTVKSTTVGNRVTGIVFTTGNTNYKGIITSGMYNVTLTNFQTYSVKIFYTTLTGANGSCNAGTLNLAYSSAHDTGENYQC